MWKLRVASTLGKNRGLFYLKVGLRSSEVTGYLNFYSSAPGQAMIATVRDECSQINNR